ncbi:MAG: tail-specific protease [Sedimenticola sp.]|jgi:carboxyl-terminal processing protease|nr:MAG: tail-specific protease [Sedimenticola sp.]
MRRFIIQIFILLALLCTGPLWANVKEVPVEELVPTREQRQAALIAIRVIDKYHYKKHKLDDEFSRGIMARYLDSLDPGKVFFTEQDVRDFNIYQDTLDDALKQARLEPAFNIYRVFRQRVDERVDYALKMLQTELDFTIDEEYGFDREDAPWAKNQKELDDLWRKRVKNDILSLRLRNKAEEKINDTLSKRYEGLRRRTHQLGSDDVFQTFLNAYTLNLEPHTSYMSPRISENFDISMRLSLEGIGAVLSSDNEYTLVQRTVAGGPADQSGKLHAGDRIVGVGQGDQGEIIDVIGWRLQDVVEQIRGPKGTVVRLQVLPEDEGEDGQSEILTLTRNEIKLEDQAAKSFVIDIPDSAGPIKVGVIELPAFYRDFRGYSEGEKNFRSTTRDVRRELENLIEQKVDGVVIDLRDNGGGSLVEATELTGLFIPTGPVVQVKGASGELEIEQDPDPELVYGGPLAVLVNRNSASASEIFAGAIQDYKRGLIIGEPTFGKGTVQTLVDLGRFVREDGDKLGRLRLTMAQFFRISGDSTQFRGVVPDIVYPTATSSEEHGERALDNALPWVSIDPTSYQPWKLDLVAKYLDNHHKRIETDPGFSYLEYESNQLIEARNRKTVSLNEVKRQQEWQTREAKRKSEKNTLRAAMGLEPINDDGDDEKIAERVDTKDDPIARVMVDEAARILSDFIHGQHQAAMVK